MKAAVFHAPNQPMTVEQVEIDKPKRREVLIRTAVAGLCHSDLHFMESKYPTPAPAILGHESSGIVEAVGEDPAKPNLAKAFGTATIIGMIPVGVKIEVHGVDLLRERRLQGSMMGSNHFRLDIPRMIDFYMQGKLKLDQMISERLKLEQINEGFAALQKKVALLATSSCSINNPSHRTEFLECQK
jgi:Zn-dependent alcohol dehydrogenase